MTGASTLACAGCGAAPPDAARRPYPFRCEQAAALPDVDHVVRRTLDTTRIRPAHPADTSPFLRYRQFLHAYHVGLDHGLTDGQYVELAGRLDEAIARVSGCGFTSTPLTRSAALETRLGVEAPGAVWIKNETGNVAGSHKARHLMGVMLYLRVVDALHLEHPVRRGLAIASCGNAALAAATVARAAGYPLQVFVPPAADVRLVERIRALGAVVEVCSRREAARGDPAYLRFRQAVADGALPFCCQGPENGLTIEGGETLWLEAAEALGPVQLDRVFVQVGGGALASACVQALDDLAGMGRLPRAPRVYAVQTRGAFPLGRAHDRVVNRIAGGAGIDEAMRYARTHRSHFMWPWEEEPHSVAHGVLDDETYDWAAVVEGMLRTGGHPVIVGEEELRCANRSARETTAIDVDHTGSAGLAGLMQVLREDPAARREQTLVVFSGARRGS